MTVKITNRQLAGGFPLIAALGNLEFEASANFKLARLIAKLEPENTAFLRIRERLVEKHAVRDADNRMKEQSPGNVILRDPAAFSAELEKLFDQQIEIAAEPITLADLGEVKVRAALLAPLLGWAIADGSAPATPAAPQPAEDEQKSAA